MAVSPTEHRTALERHQQPQSASRLSHFDSLPDSALVRVQTLMQLLGIGRATVWRWAQQGKLPAPLKISGGITAWRVGELRAAMSVMGGQK